MTATAVVAVLVLGAAAYVVARAALVGFTYDEAFTWAHYLTAPLRTVVFFAGPVAANNHTLNSILMRASSAVFGDSELSLRLPNVLAFAVYAWAVVAVIRMLTSTAARLLAAALLLCNPFLLELFSLARGYGLATAFVMGGIALLARSQTARDDAGRFAFAALVCGGLAVVSNVALLNFFVPFAAVATYACLRSGGAGDGRRPTGIRRLAPFAIVIGLVGLYAAVAVLRLRRLNELYYGGRTGFWRDTVDSLARCWLYLQPYSRRIEPMLVAVACAILAAAAVLAFAAPGGAFDRHRALMRGLLVTVAGGCLAAVVAHRAFGTPYPINRTASWILPCVMVLAALVVDAVATSERRAPAAAAASLAFVLSAASLAHFAASANTSFAILQFPDADTKQMLVDLGSLRDAPPGARGAEPIRLLASWQLVPAIEYGRVTRALTWLAPVTSDADRPDAAFLSPGDAARAADMTVTRRYPRTGNLLAIRR